MIQHVSNLGWRAIGEAIRDNNDENTNDLIDFVRIMQSSGLYPVEISILKYPSNVWAGVDQHRDDFATFGFSLVIIIDCLGYGLTATGDNLPNPLSTGNILVLDPTVVHWLPIGQRSKDHIVLRVKI